MLDELGLDYVEGGYPGANPTDTALLCQPHRMKASFAAFGMTGGQGVSASNDPGLQALVQAKGDAVCFVAKSWDYHVRVALKTTNEENLACITRQREGNTRRRQGSDGRLRAFLRRLQGQPGYALACAKTAFEAGARWVVLCDTNGGTLPHEIARSSSRFVSMCPAQAWASMPTTTPGRRSPTRWRRCAPACARSRAR
jgi:2-isopropylmalate synthase